MRETINIRENEIEFRETIGECELKSYSTVRLSRVKHRDNPHTFIDIRIFQRGYDEEGEEVYFPTKKGVQLLESRFQRLIGQWTIMPAALLHQKIMEGAFPLLIAGEFESAVFQAFKSVEVSVRDAAGLDASEIGTKLVRKAFDSEQGPLSNQDLPIGERQAVSHLFAGAIGLYKNSCSHRNLEMQFIEAFEMLLFASHLMKLIDRSVCAEAQVIG